MNKKKDSDSALDHPEVHKRIAKCSEQTRAIIRKFVHFMDASSVSKTSDHLILSLEQKLDAMQGLKTLNTTAIKVDSDSYTMHSYTDWRLNDYKDIFKPRIKEKFGKDVVLELNKKHFYLNPFLAEIDQLQDDIQASQSLHSKSNSNLISNSKEKSFNNADHAENEMTDVEVTEKTFHTDITEKTYHTENTDKTKKFSHDNFNHYNDNISSVSIASINEHDAYDNNMEVDSINISHSVQSRNSHKPSYYKHKSDYLNTFIKVPLDLAEPESLESTQFIFVNDDTKLEEMISDLMQETFIAVDVEHYDPFSYAGLTCLLQVSSLNCDYVVDVLKFLKDRDKNYRTYAQSDSTGGLCKLNKIFADKSKLKILHGARKDVEWLQKDCGIYIVNMFDTFIASKYLNFSAYGLKNLVAHYLNINLDKSLSTTDWRVRPMPAELLNYARNDTHWLIYVYERLKEDLIQLAADNNEERHCYIRETLFKSTELCRYSYKTIKPPSILDSIKQCAKYDIYIKDKLEVQTYHTLELFRDRKAREIDVKPKFLVSNGCVALLSKKRPSNKEEMLNILNPLPEFIEQNLDVILDVIRNSATDWERTVYKILDLPESNERLQKYKELKAAFDNESDDLQINIFKNIKVSDKLKKLETDFDLDVLEKVNFTENYQLNQVYDEILDKYEINVINKSDNTYLKHQTHQNKNQNKNYNKEKLIEKEQEKVLNNLLINTDHLDYTKYDISTKDVKRLDQLTHSMANLYRNDTSYTKNKEKEKEFNQIKNEYLHALKTKDQSGDKNNDKAFFDNISRKNLAEKIPQSLQEINELHYKHKRDKNMNKHKDNEQDKNKSRDDDSNKSNNAKSKIPSFSRNEGMNDSDFLRELGYANNEVKSTKEVSALLKDMSGKYKKTKKNKHNNNLLFGDEK